MADGDDGPVRGLDKDLAEKAKAKYDPKREQEAKEYIEDISGEKFSSSSFHESLKDGVLLCKMMNRIMPNPPIKITTSKMPFKQMENIAAFLDRVEKLGVPAYDRFLTVDLYEAKNMDQVINCIFSLSRYAAAAGFDGPVLGPKLASRNERTFSEEQLAQSKNIVPKLASFTSKVGSTPLTGGRREIGGIYLDSSAKSSLEDGLASVSIGSAKTAPASSSAPPASTPAVRSPSPPPPVSTASASAIGSYKSVGAAPSIGSYTPTGSTPSTPTPAPLPTSYASAPTSVYSSPPSAVPTAPIYSSSSVRAAPVAIVEEPTLRPSAVVETRAGGTAHSSSSTPSYSSYSAGGSSGGTSSHASYSSYSASQQPPPRVSSAVPFGTSGPGTTYVSSAASPPPPAPAPVTQPKKQPYQYYDDDDEEVVVIEEDDDYNDKDDIIGAYGR